LQKHDFAILVLTPDDVTESRGDSEKSPRDNVLFELGLFMGRLGRERTFIVCDRSTKLRLPSDLAGISFITYDGRRMADAPTSAVRGACLRINRIIKRPEYKELAGSWKSWYLLCYGEKGGEPIEEDVEVGPARGMLRIESKGNAKNDNYVAYGRLAAGKHIVGEWQSTRHAATAGGAFFLTMHPQGNLLYGYYVSPDDDYKVVHGGWVMARVGSGDVMFKMEEAADKYAKASGNGGAAPPEFDKDKVVERELCGLFKQGLKLLKETAPTLDKLDLKKCEESLAGKASAGASAKTAGKSARVT
jgi:hypothetical protein